MTQLLRNSSPKHKLAALAASGFLLLWVAYAFSFSRTFELRNRMMVNEARLHQIHELPQRISEFEQRLSDTGQQSGALPYDHERIFESINTFCRTNQLQLVNFHPERRSAVQNFELITNQLEVQGAFQDIVRLGWMIEHEQKLGHLASVAYKVMEDKRSGNQWLSGTFYLQHYFRHAATN